MTDEDDEYEADWDELHDGCHQCGTCESWCRECKRTDPLKNLLGYTVASGRTRDHVAAVWDVADAKVSIEVLCGEMLARAVEVGVENWNVDGQWGWEWRDAMSDLKDAYVVSETATEVLSPVDPGRACRGCARAVRLDVKPVQW